MSLTDSFTTVSYYLTTYSYASSLQQNNSLSLYHAEGEAKTSFALLAMLSIMIALGFTFGLVYALIENRAIPIAGSQATSCNYKSHKKKLVTAYCFFKFVYSIVFSLSMFMFLLRMVCAGDMEVVTAFANYHSEIRQTAVRNIRVITDFKHSELGRQYEMKRERLQACSGHSLNSTTMIRNYINKYSSRISDAKQQNEEERFNLLMDEIQKYLEATRNQIDKVNIAMTTKLEIIHWKLIFKVLIFPDV